MQLIQNSISDEPIYSKFYRSFRGLDYSTDETQIDDSRSPHAVNLISDSGGYPEKRLGFRTLHTLPSGRVNGLFSFDSGDSVRLIAHVGTQFFAIGSETVNLGVTVSNSKSTGFYFNGKLYILTGAQYLVYDGTTIKNVADIAFIPMTTYGSKPTGGGKKYQDANLLQPRRRNGFIADGTSTTFKVDSYPIDASGEIKAWVNDVVYTGTITADRTNGNVYLNPAPPAPTNEGTDNLVIEFPKAVSGYAERVLKCTIFGLFGLNSDNRIFLSGNPEHANYEYYSALNDPTYFPDLNYTVVGSSDFPILSYLKVQGELTVIKKDNQQEGTIWHHTSSEGENGAVFPVREGISGIGAVGKYSAQSLLDDPLFLSPSGVFSPVTNYNFAKYERSVIKRSEFINAKLCKEKDLQNAVSVIWNGMYILALNGHCYVADSRQNRTSSGYEWYYWDNVPAVCFLVIDDSLYFGTADGRICRFNDDMVDINGDILMRAYNDDGKPIVWQWATKLDTLGDPLRLKTIPKRGSGVHLKAYTRSAVDIYIRTESDFGKKIKSVTADTFNFNEITFERFNFVGTNNKIIPFKAKVKKFKAVQVVLQGCALNEGFGVYEIVLRYTLGNYAKR